LSHGIRTLAKLGFFYRRSAGPLDQLLGYTVPARAAHRLQRSTTIGDNGFAAIRCGVVIQKGMPLANSLILRIGKIKCSGKDSG